MLDNYVGEFLICPVPLELSLNYCSHCCSYCFANLNLRTRRADMDALLRLLADFPERETLVAYWLQRRYPICFSNRVDPFATSNIRQTVQVVEKLVEQGIPIQFQTRGPHPRHAELFTRVFSMLPEPCIWYLTIETWQENIRQHIAPGAPSIQDRLDLVEFLCGAGHVVVVGINPVVEEWLPEGDDVRLLEAVAGRGAWGVWTERLHFSPHMVGQMTRREKGALGKQVIGRACKRQTHPSDRSALDRVRSRAQAVGLEIFSVGQPNPSRFFAPWHALYRERTLPTMQGFINWCHDHLQAGEWIPWQMFRDYFLLHLPPGLWPIDAYLGSTARQLWRTHEVPAQMTYEELLRIVYVEPRYKLCPARLPSFAYAGVWSGEGWIQLTDLEGLPYLIWSPEGTHTDYYTHIEAAEREVA